MASNLYNLYKKISIITVCYNSEPTIERAIKSVILQDYPSIEYIVIDGGSMDGTVDIIKKYAKNISYWESEADRGIYDAMNKGINHATGEIVAFLNSDDWYPENIFPEIARQFMSDEMQILCGEMYVHQSGHVERWHIKEKKMKQQLRIRMGFSHPAMFVRRSLFEEYGNFDTQYQIAADYDWLLRMYDNHVSIAVTDKVLCNFSYGGISTKDEMLKVHLMERKQVSLHALEKNVELTVSEKAKWKELIELENTRDRYAYRMQNILMSGILDCDCSVLMKIRKILSKECYSVFGCGAMGKQVIHILEKTGIRIAQIWDNNEKEWGNYIDGIRICNPKELNTSKDMVIIASVEYENEIEIQLMKKGFIRNRHYLLYSRLREMIVDVISGE